MHAASPALIGQLRRQLRSLAPARPHGTLALGPAIDAALGGGFALGALHEISADGLEAELGALAARIIFAEAASDEAALAGMETALRAGAAAAVVAEAGKLGRLTGRRLQLACLRRGSTGFLLRRYPYGRVAGGADSFAVTSWRIAAAPSIPDHAEPGAPRWHIHLLAARGGTEGDWIAQPNGGSDDPYSLRLAARLADPAPAPARQRAG